MDTNMEKKSGFVAIIGRTNVGKSTLMNNIIGQKIAITSNKPQTTRNKIQTVYTSDMGQIIFVDTPGIHKSKNKLGDYMISVATKSLRNVDVILWLVEASTYIGSGDEYILGLLKEVKKPVILAINKMDTLKNNDEVLAVIDRYQKERDFDAIVPLSALQSINVDELIKVLYDALPIGPMYYDEDTVTDQPMRQIVSELIREKALRLLKDEIPHGLAVEIEKMKYRKNVLCDIDASIVCEKDSHKGIIIGKSGSMLKKIGTVARLDIEDLIQARVNLKLWVKVRKEWRDSDIFIKNFGYSEKAGF